MKLRVFLSSPGDVADERGLARQVLARLPQEAQFRGRVLIEEVSWDNPAAPVPLAAHLTPQEAIDQGLPKPAECDVVLVILWARMGTLLPAEYTKPDGTDSSRGPSGSIWTPSRKPSGGGTERRSCWCTVARSRCCSIAKRRTSPSESTRANECDRFFDGFRAPDGSLRRSYHEYVAPADFETQSL